MGTVRLILVGGFLGAGKTTLLWQAAARLAAQGRRVGLITNDQAADLVDTELLVRRGLAVGEVAGSCFCCNFPGLIRAAEKLQHDLQADVLIAEPVGSCTDLSATILQPLKDKFAQQFVPAPLSVLADPLRIKEVLCDRPGRLHGSAAYIIRKQLEEADVLVLNKADLLAPDERQKMLQLLAERFPGARLCCASALSGAGVDDWLALVLAGGEAGRKIVHVDYDIYAEGEAVLGWLNAVIRLTAARGCNDWREFCLRLMNGLRDAFRQRNAEVGHVKLLLSSGQETCAASLTRADGEPIISGQVRPQAKEADLILNARVEMEPQELESLVRNHLHSAAGTEIAVRIGDLRCLSPGRPNPTHRYDRVIQQ